MNEQPPLSLSVLSLFLPLLGGPPCLFTRVCECASPGGGERTDLKVISFTRGLVPSYPRPIIAPVTHYLFTIKLRAHPISNVDAGRPPGGGGMIFVTFSGKKVEGVTSSQWFVTVRHGPSRSVTVRHRPSTSVASVNLVGS